MTRAIPVVRQSRTHDGSVSEAEQKKRLAELFEREGWTPACEPIVELDVSGRTPLTKRKGLLRAVEMVEDDEADVIAVAYFDRLVRSIKVQAEVVERVEEAGGEVFSGDFGQLTNGSAIKKLSAGFLGLVAAYHCDTTAERVEEHKEAAVQRGVPPFDLLPPGLQKVYDAEGRCLGIEPDELVAPIIVRAFELRAGIDSGEPASMAQVQAFLRENGIDRSLAGVKKLLSSRLYLGELRFGKHFNPASHVGIVEPSLFESVQELSAPRGPVAKSDRLLARLGVLVCGSCGSRLCVGFQKRGEKVYHHYRCVNAGVCPNRVTISSAVEELVLDKMRERAGSMTEEAHADDAVNAAVAEAEAAHEELAKATRVALLSGIGDEEATVEALAELRQVAEEKQAAADRLRVRIAPKLVLRASELDPDDPEEREDVQALIRSLVREAVVSPGAPGGRAPLSERVTFPELVELAA